MSNFKTLIYEKKDDIAYVTLNRPKALNVYNIQMRDDLYEVLGAIKDDSEVSVAIFKGAGEKAFCAGADLSEFLTAPSPIVARRVRFERDVWGLFLSIPQPLIAALHGFVLGSGIEIALCCDIRIASENAQVGQTELNVGLIPGWGGTQRLPRYVGKAMAKEMIFTGKRIDAKTAERYGLINIVVPVDQFMAKVKELATQIAEKSPIAVRFCKSLINSSTETSQEAGMWQEAEAFGILTSTEDFNEGVTAFLEKRKPQYKGK